MTSGPPVSVSSIAFIVITATFPSSLFMSLDYLWGIVDWNLRRNPLRARPDPARVRNLDAGSDPRTRSVSFQYKSLRFSHTSLTASHGKHR